MQSFAVILYLIERGLGKPMPRYARAARFDQGAKQVRATCTKNTRIEILDTIHTWFSGESPATSKTLRTDGNPHGPIFWLYGVAGTGKSTIAQTVADYYHQTNQLGASFFCSRSDADCSNIALIFPTIAHQLCSLSSVFKEQRACVRSDAQGC
jgi:hypothetical protein